MRQNSTYFILLLVLAILFSCKKENDGIENCFADAATTRQITDEPATISLSGNQYYIVEEGAIDTRLKPCNLTEDFKTADLHVTVSGIVKSIPQNGMPCCMEGFVITKITK